MANENASDPLGGITAASRWATAALAVAVLSLGLIVAGASVLIAQQGKAWWAAALPAMGAYAVLILGIVFRDQDNPVTRLLEWVFRASARRPWLAVLLAFATTVTAAGLGHHLWLASQKADGELRFLVFTGENIDGRRAAGLRVVLEHLVGSGATQDRATNDKGVVGFPVNIGDAVTVRIQTEKGVYVVERNKSVAAEDLGLLRSIDLAGVPDDRWLSPTEAEDLGESVGYLSVDPSLLRWREKLGSRTLGDPAVAQRLAPFGAPAAEVVIGREAFLIGFSPNLRQPRWIASEIIGPAGPRQLERRAPDPLLPSEAQATSDDYARNIYDRADLVRRSDLGPRFGDAPERTYMTMVTPQTNVTNQRLWLDLEDYTSRLKSPTNRVFVLRGPAFEGAPGRGAAYTVLGASRIPVPTHYFQVAAVVTGGTARFECHLVPNVTVAPSNWRGRSATAYRAQLATIERMTGLQLMRSAPTGVQVCP